MEEEDENMCDGAIYADTDRRSLLSTQGGGGVISGVCTSTGGGFRMLTLDLFALLPPLCGE